MWKIVREHCTLPVKLWLDKEQMVHFPNTPPNKKVLNHIINIIRVTCRGNAKLPQPGFFCENAHGYHCIVSKKSTVSISPQSQYLQYFWNIFVDYLGTSTQMQLWQYYMSKKTVKLQQKCRWQLMPNADHCLKQLKFTSKGLKSFWIETTTEKTKWRAYNQLNWVNYDFMFSSLQKNYIGNR